MKIAILGRKKDTVNYEKYVEDIATPITTLNPTEVSSCDALILPGGGDITPAFFGEHNNGSQNIDTELDILQFQALEYALKKQIPILGICKGMQVINVAFGGTLVQDMPTSHIHRHVGHDQYHQTFIEKDSWLHHLYGRESYVNSAHHQCINRLGKGLRAVQWCPEDNCIEAIVHTKFSLLGLQWHPERLDNNITPVVGSHLLLFFSSFLSS